MSPRSGARVLSHASQPSVTCSVLNCQSFQKETLFRSHQSPPSQACSMSSAVLRPTCIPSPLPPSHLTTRNDRGSSMSHSGFNSSALIFSQPVQLHYSQRFTVRHRINPSEGPRMSGSNRTQLTN